MENAHRRPPTEMQTQENYRVSSILNRDKINNITLRSSTLFNPTLLPRNTAHPNIPLKTINQLTPISSPSKQSISQTPKINHIPQSPSKTIQTSRYTYPTTSVLPSGLSKQGRRQRRTAGAAVPSRLGNW
ncbi:unnamed protein product [Periconia digitata]|uniref:Uncharacterized protein n=1 Tax=Periconia digitata TaxID=1303443 RepID=A0A9W4XGP3_9PLEO|nr:unnamed protein product [Periconia digitata]